jgi:hypothetical protein
MASASQPTDCGSVYTKLYSGPKTDVWVSKRRRVTCSRARALTANIYGGRGTVTWHCFRGHPNCPHAFGYSMKRALPGWKFWTGPGGGSAWRGKSRIDFEFYT